MDIDQIANFVTNFGFPIVLSVYLLVRMETKMDKLTIAIQELSKMIEKICQN